MIDVLNKKSGIQGLSQESSDFRDLHAAAAKGSVNAQIAIDVFSYHVVKYIGSYAAVMNGVDVIAFTAGIGENDPIIRANVMGYLNYLGTELDPVKNDCRGEERIISTDDSKVVAMVIPTNEELAIARETVALVK